MSKAFDHWLRGFLSGMLIGSSLTCIIISLIGDK
jgi:hypothetical protein